MACPMLRATMGLMLVGSPILAVPMKVLPILVDISPVLSHILTLEAGIPVRGVRLYIAGTAAHECRQHHNFENSP